MSDVPVTSKSPAAPQSGDFVVGVQNGAVKLFQVDDLGLGATGGGGGVALQTVVDGDAATLAAANSHADGGDTATLNSANLHADQGDTATLSAAQSAAQQGDVTTLASAQSYADTKDAVTLQSAKDYADSVATAGGTSQTYVDNADAATLSSAHSYADSGDASTLSSAQSYADTGDTSTLNSAKAYADNIAVAGSYNAGGTGATSRPLVDKVKEIEASVIDYGADKTGVADSTTAFANAIHSGAKRVHVPAGTYKVSSITLDRNIEFYGDGRESTIINVTTTTTHGMRIIGDDALGRANCMRVRAFQLNYIGSGQPTTANWSGIYLQRKVIMDEVSVDGFTNDGIFFAPSNASESTGAVGTKDQAIFFARLDNVWAKNCGRDGCVLRAGANANILFNCDFSRNGRYGLFHTSATFPTYGNLIIGGQCSYNGQEGYRFESGTNCRVIHPYAELNGCTNPNNVGVGGTQYTNTNYDFYVGDNFSRSIVDLGVIYNNDNTHVRAPSSGLNDGIKVTVGGDRIFVSQSYHTPHETSTFSALSSTATLAQVIDQVNLIRTRLQSAGVVQ